MTINGNNLRTALRILDITQEQAAKKLGMSRQTLSTHLRSGELSSQFVQNVKTFLGIDLVAMQLDISNKLVAGIGKKPNPRIEAEPLYIAADPNDFDNDGTKFEDLGNGMLRFRFPVIPIKAQAGYLRGFQDPEYYDGFKTEYLEVYKEYKGHYLAFEVKGDSMTPTDPSMFPYMALEGWIAVGREVARHHWKYKLHTHNTDAWIIVHNTEGILIKSIINQDVDAGTITIHSLNAKYQDEVLSLDDISQIFAVQKYIVDAK